MQYFFLFVAVFMYTEGVHNVLKVNGTSFQQCAALAGTVALTTGNDVIPLETPGRKWYICGVGNHCAAHNMKFAITVLPKTASTAPVPVPVPTAPKVSAARGSVVPRYYALFTAVVSVIAMVIV